MDGPGIRPTGQLQVMRKPLPWRSTGALAVRALPAHFETLSAATRHVWKWESVAARADRADAPPVDFVIARVLQGPAQALCAARHCFLSNSVSGL